MRTIACNFLIIFCFISFCSLQAQQKQKQEQEQTVYDDDDFGKGLGDKIEKFVERMTRRWDHGISEIGDDDTIPKSGKIKTADIESEGNLETFSGDKVIKKLETIHSGVMVKGGDLTVFGTIEGDAVVIGGTLYVMNSGRVTGNARVVNGNIVKEDGGVIEGYEDKSGSSSAGYREPRKRFSRSSTSFDVPWLPEQGNLDQFIFRYNRVEGVFLGAGSEKKFYWDGRRSWNAYGFAGWGFRSHRWRGNLGLSRQFAILSDDGNGIIEFGAEGYNLTDTKDQWIISTHENTAASLLLHEDFRDYFERTGYTLHVAYYTQRDYLKSQLRVLYLVDSYESLTNKVDWAMFGGGKWFRANPAIQAGNMRSAIVDGGVSTVSKTNMGSEGWDLFASAEYARKQWDSEFEFDQYIVDLRRFQPLGQYDNLNFRFRIGSSNGNIPQQKIFELGGLGTMNAFPFKSEIGNRMMLINAEFILNGRFLDDLDFWPTWLFRHFNFILLSDAGLTRTSPTHATALEGFEKVTWQEFKHDFGIALGNRSGSFRFGVAWRSDVKAPAQFVFRFNRPF